MRARLSPDYAKHYYKKELDCVLHSESRVYLLTRLALQKTRAAARRAEKKAAKQAILDADPSTIAQTLTTTTYAPGVRLTKAGIPKKKSGPKPGSRRTPKEEKPKPTQAEIEQQQARGVGQPEALALLAEHFASSPVRQLSPVKREAREEELGNPAPKRKKGEDSETPATPNDESKAEMRAIKKIKKSRLSKAAGVEEAFTPAPPTTEEMEETHTSPAKKQKKSKVSKEERKEKRISDVSMKDATPITSPVSTPVPSSTKSKKEKGRFADKFHPYKKPGKYSKKDEHHELKVEQVGITENGHEDIHETEDITAEVDEKMRRHRTRVKKEERAKELGINPSEKHARESFGTAGPSPKATQESIQDSSTSAKKRKTKKSKEEKSRFNGVVGDIERKRKSPSPDPHGVEMVVEKKGRSAEEKKKRKEEKARKRAREQTWTGEEVDGMGDVVMSGGPMSE